jgi:hypothetical protein
MHTTITTTTTIIWQRGPRGARQELGQVQGGAFFDKKHGMLCLAFSFCVGWVDGVIDAAL